MAEQDNGGWIHISELAMKLHAEGRNCAYISENNNYFQNLNAIKEYYQRNMDALLNHHKNGSVNMYRVYPCDWSKIMTPIEFAAWATIRCKGRIPFYPQFPVGNYFLDFGSPHLKIGLELDGKAFHDTDKDLIRDTALYEMGWKIFRITGSEMSKSEFTDWTEIEFSHYFDYGNISILENWILNTGDGVIEALKNYYFGGNIYLPEEYHQEFRDLCFKSLVLHNLVRNEL